MRLKGGRGGGIGRRGMPLWAWVAFEVVSRLPSLVRTLRESRPERRSPKILVHVAGAVRNPGVYELPRGARVKDAIEAAGGPTDEADLHALNLAAFLEDGEKVSVPSKQ